MKEYLSIPPTITYGTKIWAFDKIDGSQIRVEWSKAKGFYKFGSRKRLIGEDAVLGQAKKILENKYADDLAKICRDSKWERAVLFMEIAGPNSFAGSHNITDTLDLTLFDVCPYKMGILPPKEYLELFGNLHIAPLLYTGPCTKEFEKTVRDSTLAGMTYEGCVCKAKWDLRRPPVMFKIKSQAWLDKVREYCGNDFNKLQELL